MKHLKLCIVAIMLFIISSCDKNKNNTDTAYFSCYIDGQYFEPEKPQGLGEYPITAKLLYDGIDLRIDASKGIQNVYIGIKDTTKVKTQEYVLSKNMGYYPRALYYNNTSGNHYETDSTYTGKASITLIDTQNMIVQGTFYFDAYNSVLNDTVHITDGKFKLKYSLH